MGLLETSSTRLREAQAEYDRICAQTDAPFGVQLFLRVLRQQDRLDEVLDWALDGPSGFLVTAVGAPAEVLPGAPLVAGGGIVDGKGMSGAFALGARAW